MPTTSVRLDLAEVASTLERASSWLRRVARPARHNAVALSTLEALDRKGPARVSDLVTQERISQPGMTGIVSRLAAEGLVERRADPSDGRAALVCITPAGEEHIRGIHELRTRTLAGRIAQLSEDDQQALAHAVPALLALAAQPSESTENLT